MGMAKVIKCDGVRVKGSIYEVPNKDKPSDFRFQMNRLTGELGEGVPITSQVTVRYDVDSLKELRSELDDVITRMEQELS